MEQQQQERQFTDMTGTWPAVATGEFDLGTADTGTEQISVMFEISDGPHKGRKVQWNGYFTEKTMERTLQSLRHCGWTCDNITVLEGLGTQPVELIISAEDYQDKETQEWKRINKVQWVNKPSRLYIKNQMDDARKAEFAQRMRAAAVMSRQGQARSGSSGARPAQGQPRASQQQLAQRGFGGAPQSTRSASAQPRSNPPPASFAHDPGPGADVSYSDDDIPF